jgi:hypothetical protein
MFADMFICFLIDLVNFIVYVKLSLIYQVLRTAQRSIPIVGHRILHPVPPIEIFSIARCTTHDATILALRCKLGIMYFASQKLHFYSFCNKGPNCNTQIVDSPKDFLCTHPLTVLQLPFNRAKIMRPVGLRHTSILTS